MIYTQLRSSISQVKEKKSIKIIIIFNCLSPAIGITSYDVNTQEWVNPESDKEDLFEEVKKHLNEEPLPISFSEHPSQSNQLSAINTKKAAPANYVKTLCKQRQKGITFELIVEIAYYVRNTEGWLERFIEDGGMRIIAKELGVIHKKAIRTQVDHKIELEILKCLDTLMNKKQGLQEAFKHSRIIDYVCMSLVSPYIPSRTQACESLTAFCVLPMGHSMVLHGMELLKKNGKNRFHLWLETIEKTLNGRGKMGSAVGASNDLKKTGMVGAGDTQITTYMFISVLFVNTIIRPDIIEDRKQRMQLGQELREAGVDRIFQKINQLNNDQINVAIQKFEEELEADHIQENMETYLQMDPMNILHILLNATQHTPASGSIHNTLCYLLKILDNPDKCQYQYQLIETLVQQVAMDQGSYPEDISGNFSVQSLIPKFSEVHPCDPKGPLDDSGNQLLEARVEYLDKELTLSKQTNSMLKILFKSTEERYKSELLEAETKLKKLQNSVRNMTEYGNPTPKRRPVRSTPSAALPVTNDPKPDAKFKTFWGPPPKAGETRNAIPSPNHPHPHQDPPTTAGFSKTIKQSFKSTIDSIVRRSDTKKSSRGNSVDSLPSVPKRSPSQSPNLTISRKSSTNTNVSTLSVHTLQEKDIVHSVTTSTVSSQKSKEPVIVEEPIETMDIADMPMPPPPPPPPEMVPFVIERKPSAFQAKQKLKFVEWEKMNFASIQKTIWHDFEQNIEFSVQKNLESADSLMEYQLAKAGVFDAVELTFAQKPAVEIRSKPTKVDITILDVRKAYNLNIFLKSITKKIPFEDSCYRFLSLDPFFLDEQVILNLIKYLPTEEERQQLARFDHASLEDIERLGVPEKFCLQMMKVKRLKERLECMLFKATFWERYTLLHKQMTSVYNASLALKDAKHFKELLHLVLLLGNFLNGNTNRGGAFGIKIASINRLIDTKGTSKSTTLLHFLVDAVEKNFPNILPFLEELDECALASKTTRVEMNIEFEALKKDLGQLESELTEHYPESSGQDEGNNMKEMDKFQSTMHQFFKEASSEFKRVCMLSNKMEETYAQTVMFYGEDPSMIQPNEFFGIFKTFVSDWERCSNDSKALKLRMDRMEKQKKRENERRKRVSSNVSMKNEGEDDRAILHSLLDKLKKDTLEVKVRRKGDRHRQRSISVSAHQNVDSIYLTANKMLRSIQNDTSSPILCDSPINSAFDAASASFNSTRRRMSASVAMVSSYKPLYEEDHVSTIPEERTRRSARPVSAIIIPKQSTSSQSITTPTRPVRVRKTSKRPIFDHTLRSRARRLSAR
ncbi:hypothetical protein BDB01DRAFT_810325 [Pilobolus umbonatus]|nr:hypothetical protein BDB01DRAFT_810325 [Pilobolus umbonatus]